MFLAIAELKAILNELNVHQKSFLTVQEASVYLSISESELYKKTSKKEIPYHQPGGKLIYFFRQDLENWILKHRVKSDEELTQEINLKDRKGGRYYGK